MCPKIISIISYIIFIYLLFCLFISICWFIPMCISTLIHLFVHHYIFQNIPSFQSSVVTEFEESISKKVCTNNTNYHVCLFIFFSRNIFHRTAPKRKMKRLACLLHLPLRCVYKTLEISLKHICTAAISCTVPVATEAKQRPFFLRA